MTTRMDLLDRLAREAETTLLCRLKNLLSEADTRVVAGQSTLTSVSEAHRLWATRFRNMDLTGKRLEGAELLLASLEELTQQRKLEQFALMGSELAANIFFLHSKPGVFVGAVVFRRSDTATDEPQRHESALTVAISA